MSIQHRLTVFLSTFLVPIIVLFPSGLACAASSEEVQTIVLTGELVDKNEIPQFYDESSINHLLTQDYESLGDSPAVITDAQMTHYRVSRLLESVLQTELDNQGCLPIDTPRHREEMFLRPPDAFTHPARGSQQTPLDLVERAPEIIIVEVENSEPGVLDGELGTLVRFEVVEWLRREPQLDALGEPAFLVAPNLRLEIGGRAYCQQRSNSSWPQEGKRFVVFGYRERTITKYFVAGNLFPIEGGTVLPQPYFLMDARFPVSLETLKESIE